MDRPSRTKMLKHNPRYKSNGDLKIEASFKDGNTSALAVHVSSTTEDFVKSFCAKHNLTYTVKGDYYYLS